MPPIALDKTQIYWPAALRCRAVEGKIFHSLCRAGAGFAVYPRVFLWYHKGPDGGAWPFFCTSLINRLSAKLLHTVPCSCPIVGTGMRKRGMSPFHATLHPPPRWPPAGIRTAWTFCISPSYRANPALFQLVCDHDRQR